MAKRYNKEFPGADLVFRPSDMDSYAERSWDVRISLGGAPLEEAFFCTVDAWKDVDRSILSVLKKYALNVDYALHLDLDHYPELTFLQEELVQIFSAAEKRQLDLRVYVNGYEGEIDLQEPVRDYLSASTFRNKTWDYLVLDLVLDLEPIIFDGRYDEFCKQYASVNLERVRAEEEQLTSYDRFFSVSVAPFALGVPDGFDLRLQMMEYDGLDPVLCALVMTVEQHQLDVGKAFACVYETLAYKTNFSADVLKEIKQLGALG